MSLLVACGGKQQETKEQVSSVNEVTKQYNIDDIMKKDISASDKKGSLNVVENVVSDTGVSKSIECFNKNIDDYYGFSEDGGEAFCQSIKKINLKSYTCDFSESSFSGTRSTLLVKNNNHYIYTYPNLESCKEEVNERNANAETA